MLSLLMLSANAFVDLNLSVNEKPLFVADHGKCYQDDQFTIKDVDDLKGNLEDLECIFQAGLPLEGVPLGPMYGTLLLATNSTIPAALSKPFYQGDYSYSTGCITDNNLFEKFYLSTLRLSPGIKMGVSRNTISKYPSPLANGEQPYEAGNTLVMDFTFNQKEFCNTSFEQGNFDFIKNSTFPPFGASNIPPVNGYVDVGVLVGYNSQKDRLILLNKAMAYNQLKNEFETILFYAIEAEDTTAASDLSFTSIEVPYTFEWSRPKIPSPPSISFSGFKSVRSFFDPIRKFIAA